VKVFWLNKELLQHRIREAVKNLVLRHPEAKQVILFGSTAENRETSLSDIDILIVVDDSKHRFLDRALPFKKYFQDIGLEVNIFVYTCKELEENIPVANIALKKGEVLYRCGYCTPSL
jgi:predicted nucleotidyltransferase